MKPFFSLVVPACDVEPYIEECLQSVLKQSFQDWECLIGIETSKDKTEEIIRKITAGDSRFRIFTGPRSGSCSASRNTGVDMATGKYVIFLDGDDTIAEGSLQRLHDKIAAHPDADLYPCTVLPHNEITGKDEQPRDNYPHDAPAEMTGIEATLLIARHLRHPDPMMQLTVCRREFIKANNLRCIYGLRGQDREFSPRALYLAKRVVPTHEPFYLYRKRAGAVTTSIDKGLLLDDQATIHKSLLAFHAKVSRDSGFDVRVSESWCRCWMSWMFFIWFAPKYLKNIPRFRRIETLNALFSDGFDDFLTLLKSAPLRQRIAGWWFRAFVQIPFLRIFSELFFKCYFGLSKMTG